MSELTFENDAILLFDSNRGIYIPQNFAEEIIRDYVSGVSDEVWKTLENGPDDEWYWEAWDSVMDSAEITVPEQPGIKFSLWQDGDVWLVPKGCEIPEW